MQAVFIGSDTSPSTSRFASWLNIGYHEWDKRFTPPVQSMSGVMAYLMNGLSITDLLVAGSSISS